MKLQAYRNDCCGLGTLSCLDGYMNVAMENTQELVAGQVKNNFGDAFIRGNNGEHYYSEGSQLIVGKNLEMVVCLMNRQFSIFQPWRKFSDWNRLSLDFCKHAQYYAVLCTWEWTIRTRTGGWTEVDL